MQISEFNKDYYNFFASVLKDLNCTVKGISNNFVFEVYSIDKKKKFFAKNEKLFLRE